VINRQNFLFFSVFGLFSLIGISCSSVRIPTVPDYRLERQVADEIGPILRVTEDRDNAGLYRIQLSDFPRKDILGMSVGSRHIYVSYALAERAFKDGRENRYRWLLRQILAHEVAHEISGHAKSGQAAAFNSRPQGRGVSGADIGLPSNVRFEHYSMEKELEADLRGMDYWSRLHWDCRIWVDILEGFRKANYAGDIFHPTDERLKQALGVCPQAHAKAEAPAARPSTGPMSPGDRAAGISK